MAGKTEDVGNPADYSFEDPTGNYSGQQANLANLNNMLMSGLGRYGAGGGAFDPNAYMNQFMGQAGGLSNMVSGALSPMQQALNAQAARSAQLGGESALAALGPGSRNSGAANAAFAQAYADPFAQAALQTQQNQLGLTGALWGQAMGGNLQSQQGLQSLLSQGLGLQTGMAQDQGYVYQPTYQYQPGAWDYLMQGGQVAAGFLPSSW